MSKIMTNIKLVLFAAVLTTQGCNWSTEWTEEKRQEFKEKCDTQRVFNPNPICFLGFDLDDVDSILVFEKKGYVIIDTITVRLQKGYRSEIDRNNKKYWGASEKDFNIEYSYRFELSPTRLFFFRPAWEYYYHEVIRYFDE